MHPSVSEATGPICNVVSVVGRLLEAVPCEAAPRGGLAVPWKIPTSRYHEFHEQVQHVLNSNAPTRLPAAKLNSSLERTPKEHRQATRPVPGRVKRKVAQNSESLGSSSASMLYACSVCGKPHISLHALTIHATRCLKCRQGTKASAHAAVDPTWRQQLDHTNMKVAVSDSLALMRLGSTTGAALIPNSMIATFKEEVSNWHSLIQARLKDSVTRDPRLASDPVRFSNLLTDVFHIFDGLQTEASEMSYLKGRVPYVAPIERRLGVHVEKVTDAEGFTCRSRPRVAYCYDMPLAESLGRLFRQDSRAWKHVLDSQSSWRRAAEANGQQVL